MPQIGWCFMKLHNHENPIFGSTQNSFPKFPQGGILDVESIRDDLKIWSGCYLKWWAGFGPIINPSFKQSTVGKKNILKSPSEFLSINILSPWHLYSWVSGDLGSFRNLRYWLLIHPLLTPFIAPPEIHMYWFRREVYNMFIYSDIFHVWCFQRKWCPAACSFPCPTTKKPLQKVLQRGPTSLPERRTPQGLEDTWIVFECFKDRKSDCMSGINFYPVHTPEDERLEPEKYVPAKGKSSWSKPSFVSRFYF